ncbi:MAG TPA: transposase [Candidatus Acidoferrum sp.]
MTTKAWQNVAVFQVAAIAEVLLAKLLEYRNRNNYLLHEFVLMPNHLHIVLTPAGTTTLEKAINLKGRSSHPIHRVRPSNVQIWQSGFHESRIRGAADYQKRADYIRFNSVVAKLVENPIDWLFTSASGKCELDPTPQGRKPLTNASKVVGPEGPTTTANVRSGGA